MKILAGPVVLMLLLAQALSVALRPAPGHETNPREACCCCEDALARCADGGGCAFRAEQRPSERPTGRPCSVCTACDPTVLPTRVSIQHRDGVGSPMRFASARRAIRPARADPGPEPSRKARARLCVWVI